MKKKFFSLFITGDSQDSSVKDEYEYLVQYELFMWYAAIVLCVPSILCLHKLVIVPIIAFCLVSFLLLIGWWRLRHTQSIPLYKKRSFYVKSVLALDFFLIIGIILTI